MPLISISVDGRRIADAIDRLTASLTRIGLALGVADPDAAPPPEPKTAAALAEEITYDDDQARLRRELEALLRRAPDDPDAADAVRDADGTVSYSGDGAPR